MVSAANCQSGDWSSIPGKVETVFGEIKSPDERITCHFD